MDYEKVNKVVEKLESKHIVGSAKGQIESREILAVTSAYRVLHWFAKITPVPISKEDFNNFLNDIYASRDGYSTGKIIDLMRQKINGNLCPKCNNDDIDMINPMDWQCNNCGHIFMKP